jgi:chemotaxis protein MotA
VLGGFMMAGGKVGALMHLSEFVIIGGAALGALIIMSPKRVLVELLHQSVASLKGAPYGKQAYEDLFKALYELFMLGRRNGMIALEEHVINPKTSSIFSKYPSFVGNKLAVEFLCNALRPIIDGKIKPDQLRLLLDIEMDAMEEEHHQPVNVLTKAADAMPGFGIVAAVMGIVITMGAIAGPIEQIGHKVAAALVGTFLGIFLSYGFMNPLAVNIDFNNAASMAYIRCIAAAVIGFATGMAPIMAVEVARRGLGSDVKPGSDDLERMLKSLASPGAK